MNNQYVIPSHRRENHSSLVLLIGVLFFFSSCAIAKKDQALNRSYAPEARAGVPANVSEIRELQFNKLSSENNREVLYLAGQLFTKSLVGSQVQIVPCAGCIVLLRTPDDTSTRVRIQTEKDGYFEFQGKNQTYSISLDNPEMNRMDLGNVDFEKNGITTLRIISAEGNTAEHFVVTKTGVKYTWVRVPKPTVGPLF